MVVWRVKRVKRVSVWCRCCRHKEVVRGRVQRGRRGAPPPAARRRAAAPRAARAAPRLVPRAAGTRSWRLPRVRPIYNI